jgi:hypothetical protein
VWPLVRISPEPVWGSFYDNKTFSSDERTCVATVNLIEKSVILKWNLDATAIFYFRQCKNISPTFKIQFCKNFCFRNIFAKIKTFSHKCLNLRLKAVGGMDR